MTPWFALQLLFIALKLLNKIQWSWATVLIPFYGYLVITTGFIIARRKK